MPAPRQDLIERAERAKAWADHFDKEAGEYNTLTGRRQIMRELAQIERAASNLYSRLARMTK